MDSPLYITSEIGKLKTILLHRPGAEVENLTPEYLAELLYDDIPFLQIAQEEGFQSSGYIPYTIKATEKGKK